MPKISLNTLDELNQQIVSCERCARLRTHCSQVASVRRRAYSTWEYWGGPVSSFGDPEARVMILGLAPGAHGSNRTGRPFTGDGSGDFLYPVLHDAGFASQAKSTSREDGMKLHDLWISAAVRCAPPGNKPLPEEIANCSSYLDDELALLKRLRVVVCLGRIAFDAHLAHLVRAGKIERRSAYLFAHGAEYQISRDRWVIASYHPSLQNTNTGRLTRPMFAKIFSRAHALAES